jgi:hypothetical protein
LSVRKMKITILIQLKPMFNKAASQVSLTAKTVKNRFSATPVWVTSKTLLIKFQVIHIKNNNSQDFYGLGIFNCTTEADSSMYHYFKMDSTIHSKYFIIYVTKVCSLAQYTARSIVKLLSIYPAYSCIIFNRSISWNHLTNLIM